MVVKRTEWFTEQQLLLTELSGNVSTEDVKEWEASLITTLKSLNDGARFKFMANLHGFKAVDITAHKTFREIIPRTLANYGWRVGYLNLFPEAKLKLKNERGILCFAAAHVHHDETKIQLYEANHSHSHEHFFTDSAKARKWIDSIRF